jgi:signal transduction protein with GAF and PtsI domain
VQKSGASLELVEEILKLLGQIVDFRSASLYMFSNQNGKLEEICNLGRRADLIDFVSFEMGNGISAWVAKHKRPIILNNLRKSKGGTHTRSFLSVPIIFEKETRGVLNLSHDEPDSYTKRDSEIVVITVSMLALLLERITTLNTNSAVQKDLDALKAELEFERMSNRDIDISVGSEEPTNVLNQRLANPLAIIAGNAQFLMMTMKGSGQSVLRRLKAIDKEASNILAMTQQQTASQNEAVKELSLRLNSENRLFLQTRDRFGKNRPC